MDRYKESQITKLSEGKKTSTGKGSLSWDHDSTSSGADEYRREDVGSVGGTGVSPRNGLPPPFPAKAVQDVRGGSPRGRRTTPAGCPGRRARPLPHARPLSARLAELTPAQTVQKRDGPLLTSEGRCHHTPTGREVVRHGSGNTPSCSGSRPSPLTVPSGRGSRWSLLSVVVG